ncbi:MAG: DUF2155 domain-containing protein [Mariprofundaceae bacterium]|nr:DUF2155 domain-containing protein [Mariprofundaceae bacterium]
MVLILCTGCDNKQQNSIQWQLPLQAPEDAHTAKIYADMPAWAGLNQGQIELVFLHKNTARKTVISVSKGQVVSFKNWRIRVLGLAQGLRIKSGALLDDPDMHNAAAFVALENNEKLVYRGWFYQEFPELFGLDDPNWKVWLKSMNIQPDLKEKTGSLSSAG